ncbi:MAG: hypothetical protein K0R75_2358 [Paenibacillaceae bacterium]|nr:hypothetical protein [Paenibacillaceae bacterium]
MSKKMNVAIIGTGARGDKHIQAWQKLGHNVVSVTDIDSARAMDVARQYGIGQIYTDYKEALDDADVHIASVCVPLAFHAPVTIYAAKQGKHIYCEKPVSRHLSESYAMEEAVREAGVKFCLGFQRNLSQGVKQLAEWAQSGLFGRPLVFSSELLQEIRPKRTMHDANGNMGPIVDTCCHDFLMWQTVFQSKPKTVYARGGILANGAPELAHISQLAVDTATIIVEFESGDIGQMTVSWGLPPGIRFKGNPDRVFGPRGGAIGKANTGAGRLTLYEGNQSQEIALEFHDLLVEQFEMFIAAIEHGGPDPIGFATSNEMLRLSLAVLESIETGKVVNL